MRHSAWKFNDILPFHFDVQDPGQNPTLHVHAFFFLFSSIAGFMQIQHSFYLNLQSCRRILNTKLHS